MGTSPDIPRQQYELVLLICHLYYQAEECLCTGGGLTRGVHFIIYQLHKFYWL